MDFGTEEQKERFVRPFTGGERVGSFALSEPGQKIKYGSKNSVKCQYLNYLLST